MSVLAAPGTGFSATPALCDRVSAAEHVPVMTFNQFYFMNKRVDN